MRIVGVGVHLNNLIIHIEIIFSLSDSFKGKLH